MLTRMGLALSLLLRNAGLFKTSHHIALVSPFFLARALVWELLGHEWMLCTPVVALPLT